MTDKKFEEIMQRIKEHFSNPENVTKLKEHMEEYLSQPCMTHLQCNEMWCEHNKPENPDMGTITWCNKYLNEQEEQCKKECPYRTYYIF